MCPPILYGYMEYVMVPNVVRAVDSKIFLIMWFAICLLMYSYEKSGWIQLEKGNGGLPISFGTSYMNQMD